MIRITKSKKRDVILCVYMYIALAVTRKPQELVDYCHENYLRLVQPKLNVLNWQVAL